MTKPFEVKECKYGVEITLTKGINYPGPRSMMELLTVEEAEDLANQLFDAARERRMNAEDYND